MPQWLDSLEPRELSFWIGTLCLSTLLPIGTVSASAISAGASAGTVVGEAQLWLVAFSLIAASFVEVLACNAAAQVRLVLGGTSIVLLIVFLPAIYHLTGVITHRHQGVGISDEVLSWGGLGAVAVGVLFARITLKWTEA